MLTEAVARTLDMHDDGMVQEPIQQGCGDDRIPEDLSPFGETSITGQDHGATFISGVDELEEQVSGSSADSEVSDLIDYEQLRSTEIANALA
jgi:hypothetical protein